VKHAVLAATLTPFGPDGALALERLPDYLAFLIEHGVDGFLALGTNGEFASLTVDERERALEAHVAAAQGRRVLANVGGTVTGEVLRLAAHAARAGADAVSLLPPYYFPITERAFADLARRVADAFGRPIYLYNIPRYTRFTIPVATVAALAAEGVCVGIKDSSQDLDYLRAVRAAAPYVDFMMGSDTTLLEGLEAGATGVASGMANTFPDVVVGATRAFEAGADLAPWAERVRALRTLFGAHPYLTATRTAIRLRGFDLGPVRTPLAGPGAEERARIEQALAPLLADLEVAR
jgi:4-hydroxy-tetrahydrodipicolinate synthase/2-dehydro-3-deoxy-phosphogluconate/2-dehydro-3-deoxy-6-phosphogalactonate aldolase